MSAVKVYERLDDIPASYLKLFDRASRKSPFLGMPWFKNLAAGAFEPGNRVRIYGYETTIAGVEQPAAALLMRHTDATLAGR
jgi:hypothetical protein